MMSLHLRLHLGRLARGVLQGLQMEVKVHQMEVQADVQQAGDSTNSKDNR